MVLWQSISLVLVLLLPWGPAVWRVSCGCQPAASALGDARRLKSQGGADLGNSLQRALLSQLRAWWSLQQGNRVKEEGREKKPDPGVKKKTPTNHQSNITCCALERLCRLPSAAGLGTEDATGGLSPASRWPKRWANVWRYFQWELRASQRLTWGFGAGLDLGLESKAVCCKAFPPQQGANGQLHG